MVHVIKQEDGDVVTCFAVSPDDETLVIAYRNLLLMQWDWKNEQCMRTWKVCTVIHFGVYFMFEVEKTLCVFNYECIRMWIYTYNYGKISLSLCQMQLPN